MLAILLALTALAGPDPDDLARVFPSPPWGAQADETAAAASPAFKPCEELVRDLARRTGARLTDERYTLSPRWGKIVRVRFVANDPYATASHLTCWFKTGHGDVRVLDAPEHMF